MDHRPLPEQRAGGRIDTDDFHLRWRDDLPDAIDRCDDRRGVARPVSGPVPDDSPGVQVECGQRTLVVAADVEDHVAGVHERRERVRRVEHLRAGPGFCQTCLPLAASQAVTMPVMPIE